MILNKASFDKTFIIGIYTRRPDLLRDPRSGEQIFTRLQFAKPPREEDIGRLVLYRDYYMAGWGLKEVSPTVSNALIQYR